MVILSPGNLLKTRKREVWLVTRDSQDKIEMTEAEMEAGKEIEQKIVERIRAFHLQFQEAAGQKG